jgi:hypothetical protein
MRDRCCNPNCKSYPNWDGRAINICDRWLYGDQGTGKGRRRFVSGAFFAWRPNVRKLKHRITYRNGDDSEDIMYVLAYDIAGAMTEAYNCKAEIVVIACLPCTDDDFAIGINPDGTINIVYCDCTTYCKEKAGEAEFPRSKR